MAMLVSGVSFAQFQQMPKETGAPVATKALEYGMLTPFQTTDINGNLVDVEAWLDSGYYVLMDVSAVWCSWCWKLHQAQALEIMYDRYGPNGTNELRVLWVEADGGSLAQVQGQGSGTMGDWTNGGTVPYPIAIDESVISKLSLGIEGFPTVIMVCPSGYYQDAYNVCSYNGSTFDGNISATNMYSLIESCPQAGAAPVVELNGPTQVLKGNTVTFTADYISVDQVTGVNWTIQGGSPATSTAESVNVSWNTTGNYTVTLEVTNTTGTTTVTKNINVFEWNWGETMSYAGETADNAYGFNGGSSTWGAMFPSQFLAGRQYMKNVSFYLTNNGLNKPVTVSLYKGGTTAPATQFYTRTVSSLELSEGWNTVNMSGEVPIDATQNLWVVLSSTASYPMTVGAYCGDPNGSWVQSQGSWANFVTDYGYEYTFMIKATTANSPNAGISTLSNIDMQIYPNPTTGNVNVIAEGVESIDVIDMTGRTVMSTNESIVDMSNMANGVYMFRVNTVNGSSMQKVVKK